MRITRAGLQLLLALLSISRLAGAADGGSVPALDGLVSRAAVTGPRGTFVAEMISLADGTTRFVQTYPGNDPTTRSRVDLLAISGNRSYQRNEKGEFEAAPPGMAAFILGHDAVRRAHAAGSRPGSLSSPAPAEMGGGTVTIEYGDYRRVIGLQLPFAATFVHSAAPGDRFVYRYTELLPFRVAPGSPSPGGAMQAALLFERLGDLAEIGRAHERVMAAHRASDAELLTADAADRSIVSGRGMLSETRRDEQLTRMRGYLGSVRFSRYEDTQAPVIAMSADGTLAWLACEMEAEGVRNADGKSEPLAYAFSWVEFYARESGSPGHPSWRAIGNASSQKP
jgi:hypothetical protein